MFTVDILAKLWFGLKNYKTCKKRIFCARNAYNEVGMTFEAILEGRFNGLTVAVGVRIK